MSNPFPFSYAGVNLPPPDSDGITIALQPIDDAERNANGDLFIQPIALKRAVNVSWGKLKGNEANKIMALFAANRTGALVFYNPETGGVDSKEVYYGAGVSVNLTLYDENLEKQHWSSLRVNFIEM
jgi:hypothetical protein